MSISIKGIKKDFEVDRNDTIGMKMAMLIEGQCTIGVQEAVKKYGYTQQRYYQLLNQYKKGGAGPN